MDVFRILCVALPVLALALSSGCAGQPSVSKASGPDIAGEASATRICLRGAVQREVVQAAAETLERMHFAIEKLDAEQGIVRTEPLTGAQVFEFWRSDNASAFSALEASLHTIRRTVQLQIGQEAGRVCVDCDVAVQRLSLPENEVASISQVFQMHSRSTVAVQRLELNPQQRQAMAWTDLGTDRELAARILKRIAARLERAH